jgi:hypothetical protein
MPKIVKTVFVTRRTVTVHGAGSLPPGSWEAGKPGSNKGKNGIGPTGFTGYTGF